MNVPASFVYNDKTISANVYVDIEVPVSSIVGDIDCPRRNGTLIPRNVAIRAFNEFAEQHNINLKDYEEGDLQL